MKRIITLWAAGALTLGAAAQPQETSGEVTRVDRTHGRVTLRHGEIRHLDMPPRTMAYRVADTRALERLEVGAKVRFVAEKVDGQYVVTRIKKAP